MAAVADPAFDFHCNETDIAVGLSGGGDSMALTHMVCRWAANRPDRQVIVHALNVDHSLRPQSGRESAQIGEWVRDWPNLVYRPLVWDHPDGLPQTAVMEQARQARYALLLDYCRSHAIATLCVAHHGDDQIETFLFRLAKGSGIDGLAAMRTEAAIGENDGIRLYRPLLSWSHAELISYCRDHGLPWIEDPSNADAGYARPRLRQSRDILAAEGLTAKRLGAIAGRMGRAAAALDHYADIACREAVTVENAEKRVFDWKKLSANPPEIIIRVLQKTLAATGRTQSGYPPKLERVEEIAARLLSGGLKGKTATLHGCLVSLSQTGDILEIVRE